MIDVNGLTKIPTDCSLTEFVGTTVLDTIGLVIPGIDASLLGQMQLKKPYRSLGLISSRTGAAGQINAVTGDASAVKNAVLTARETGLRLLVSMGSYPETPSKPFL